MNCTDSPREKRKNTDGLKNKRHVGQCTFIHINIVLKYAPMEKVRALPQSVGSLQLLALVCEANMTSLLYLQLDMKYTILKWPQTHP
jgi:hypothetical protein